MNWNLIVRLSFFGFLIGALGVSILPVFIEALLWLVAYLYSANVIAKRCDRNYFINGFMLSMLNTAWLTGFHVIFYKIYFKAHPEMDLLYASLPLSDFPRLGLIVFTPVFGLFFAVVLGFFSFVMSKLVKKPAIEK